MAKMPVRQHPDPKTFRRWDPEQENFYHWARDGFWKAYYDARKGKRSTPDEAEFELNLGRNMQNLIDEALSGFFTPSAGIAFVTFHPVIREIFAAPFRDRIVHHFLYNMVAGWWDRRMIPDSYSCRNGKGTLYGAKRLQHHMRSVSQNYSKDAVVIKMDIRGYFMSLNRKELFNRVCWGLDQQFPEKNLDYRLCKMLWWAVIFDDPTEHVTRRGWPRDWARLPRAKSLFFQPAGTGIVIGNLTSQLLSNIFLDQLDRFITMDLGYKHYGRYVDDFFIVIPKEDLPKALKDLKLIRVFLKEELGLTLHPKKTQILDARKGVEFLGVRIYPGCIIPGKRFEVNFRKAAYEFATGRGDRESVQSYLGLAKHFNMETMARKIFAEVGWDYTP